MSEASDKAESRYASRKFILSLLIIAIGVSMFVWGKVPSTEVIDLMKWVSGLYFGFNVAQKIGEWTATKGSQ